MHSQSFFHMTTDTHSNIHPPCYVLCGDVCSVLTSFIIRGSTTLESYCSLL